MRVRARAGYERSGIGDGCSGRVESPCRLPLMSWQPQKQGAAERQKIHPEGGRWGSCERSGHR